MVPASSPLPLTVEKGEVEEYIMRNTKRGEKTNSPPPILLGIQELAYIEHALWADLSSGHRPDLRSTRCGE